MRGKIQTSDGLEATLDQGVWISSDPGLESLLNSYTILLRTPTGPYRPDPDGEILSQASVWVSAEIVEDTPPEYVPGRVY